ncbi:MAG: penicillin-binding protein 2 [Actinobacteria bacterium]|nr:MAG: penicillin-binding protein 2 [Actinomycetota bacterium]REK32938.1 MAG: penicillin-binding protein 2 [Actinomycetota bacterium]
MNGPIRRLALGLFASMAALLIAVTWFQVFRADALKNDPRNARPALSERGKERGLIVTNDGTVLARSDEDPNDALTFVRTYPEGPAFAHVVGYSSFLLGNTGLEQTYSQDLRSRRDITISDLVAVILGRDLRPSSIEVTIDAELQKAAFAALAGRRGAVVALDPNTGAVLASVSSPSFDPEALIGDDADAAWNALLEAEGSPLSDRATRELYAPGSTFKTVVAAAGIDTGFVGPESVFPDPVAFPLPGSEATISNYGGRVCADGETVTLLRAFVVSCNTTFANLAIQLGAADLGITAEALGFNRELEFAWQIPPAQFNIGELEDDPAALGQSGIGERDVRAAPLHMAMIAATIANGGQLYSPYLVSRVFDADGNTVETTEPVPLGRAMAPTTASIMTQMMERVVTEGTGTSASVAGVRVAGKTGTAQGSGEFPHPWFIGFAPVENPTIALAVFLEGGPDLGETATGGGLAAPIASTLIDIWLSGEQ